MDNQLIKKTIFQARYQSLKSRYNSEMEEGWATVTGYLYNPSHIGEHPQIAEEIDAALSKMVDANDKLKQLDAIVEKISSQESDQINS